MKLSRILLSYIYILADLDTINGGVTVPSCLQNPYTVLLHEQFKACIQEHGLITSQGPVAPAGLTWSPVQKFQIAFLMMGLSSLTMAIMLRLMMRMKWMMIWWTMKGILNWLSWSITRPHWISLPSHLPRTDEYWHWSCHWHGATNHDHLQPQDNKSLEANRPCTTRSLAHPLRPDS